MQASGSAFFAEKAVGKMQEFSVILNCIIYDDKLQVSVLFLKHCCLFGLGYVR